MRRDLKAIFMNDIKKIAELQGVEKRNAERDLNERLDAYMAAEDFAFYYPQIYTPDALLRIAKSRNSTEASNIMTSLRRALPC